MSINEQYEQVKEFHTKFHHPVATVPTLMNMDRALKRYKWMKEEIDEFITATENEDIYEQADAMIDCIYFCLGTLVEMGIPPLKIFNIVQNANMSKLWDDGLPHFSNNGKVIKPDNWKDPHDAIVKCIDSMKGL